MFICESLIVKTWQIACLDPILGVHEAHAASVHVLVQHETQINQKPEPDVGVRLCGVHVLRFVGLFHKEAASRLPKIGWAEAFVVQPVGRVVDCDADFRQVEVEELFGIPGTRDVRLTKRRRIAFNDHLWGLTLMVRLTSVFFPNVIVFSRWTSSYKNSLPAE